MFVFNLPYIQESPYIQQIGIQYSFSLFQVKEDSLLELNLKTGKA